MLTLYHGTNANFDQFTKEKARMTNDFYGGGVAYLTDNKNIALTYGKSMTKTQKFGRPIIMTVMAGFKKIFDVDHEFTGKDLMNLLPTNIEQFARGAGLLKFGAEKYDVISKLKNGKFYLTGKQIFYGLSAGMNKTAEARDWLIKKGYDALRYNGGENMGTAIKHNVYIAFNNLHLKIIKKETLKTA